MPLEVDVARLTLDDDATGELKKVDKKLDRTNKKLEQTEKQTEDVGREVKKTGNIFTKSFRRIQDGAKKTGASIRRLGDQTKKLGRGAGKAGAGATKSAAAAGSGGGLGGAFGSLPFGLGAGIALGFASVEKVRRDFVSGLGVKKELLGIANDFNSALKGERKSVLREFRKTGVFRTEDIQAAATSLADAGVSGEAIKKNADILSKFALSQGFTDISEAIGAVRGGTIKAGRGIDTADIVQFREISSLLSSVETADIGFKLLTDILEKNRTQIEKNAKTTQKTLGNVTRQQNEQIKFEQDRAVKAASIDESLITASRDFVEIADDLSRVVAEPAGKVLSGGVDLARRFGVIDKRQLGGTVQKGRSFLVGERGPELFIPPQSGQVINNNKMEKAANASPGRSSMSKSVSINAPINITLPQGTAANTAQAFGREFEKEVSKVMNKFAATVLREESGLNAER